MGELKNTRKRANVFFEDGQPVQVQWPAVYDEPEDDVGALRREVIARLLEFLAADSLDPLAIGKRLLLLANLTGVGRAGQFTGDELAALFGVTPGRISQLKAQILSADFLNRKTRALRGKAAQRRAAAKVRS